MGGEADLKAASLENMRRYRAIASLYRQTAAFRPEQSLSLLQQAEHWERLAAMELEIECESDASVEQALMLQDDLVAADTPTAPQVDTRWWLPRREGLFAGLQA